MPSLVLMLALGCGGGAPVPSADAPIAPQAAARTLIRLARTQTDVVLDLPPSNLPPGRAAGVVPLREAFTRGRSVRGVDVWTIAMPFPEPSPGEGVSLSGPGGSLPRSDTPRPGTWSVHDGRLEVYTKAHAAAPPSRGLKLRSEALAREEGALSLDASTLDASAFAFRRVTSTDGAFEGVYLPAPASATWTLTIPPGAVFQAEVRLVPAPVGGAGTDGASVVLEAVGKDGVVTLARAEATREGAVLQASLAAVAGEGVQLRLRSDPGATRYYDYVLVVDPTVHVPSAEPQRVLLVQVTGLGRPDLASGGDALAGLAASSVVFDDAWTTAPVTLPATRSVLSGGQPERWAERPSLAERLTATGFASAAIVDDPALLGADGVDRGWTIAVPAPARQRASDVAAGWLQAHPGRDALLLVQVGAIEDAVTPIGPTSLETWRGAPARPTSHAAALADVDDQLARLVAAAGPSAWVVLYADHGLHFEGSRAGHADVLTDDVVHVPLLVHGPGMPAVHRDTPVSLLDLAPTVLDLVGLQPPDDIPGRSLKALLVEPPEDASALIDRPLAFGRARGDAQAWGLVDHGVVWRTGDPVPDGIDPEKRLDEALGTGIRTTTTTTAARP